MLHIPLNRRLHLPVTKVCEKEKTNSQNVTKCDNWWYTHQNFTLSNTFPDVIDAFLFPTAHRKVWCYAAYIDQEIGQHLFSIWCEINFRMELNSIDFQLFARQCRNDSIGCVTHHF